MTAKKVPFVVRAPFDEPADVILRSSQDGDDHDFHVYKGILIVASPIFKQMFADAKPSTQEGDECKDGLPIIKVQDSALVLDALLRLIYPVEPPTLEGFSLILGVIVAAKKYEMSRAILLTSGTFQTTIQKDYETAVQAYMIASAQSLDDLAQRAAIETLKYPIKQGELSLSRLSDIAGTDAQLATHLWRLLCYRDKVIQEISTLFPDDAKDCHDVPVRPIYTCDAKVGCAGNHHKKYESGNTVRRSVVWYRWRAAVLQSIYRAPLAAGSVALQSALEIIATSNCISCRQKEPAQLMEPLDTIQRQMEKVATEVSLSSIHAFHI